MNTITVGLDIAKSISQVHGVDACCDGRNGADISLCTHRCSAVCSVELLPMPSY